VRFKILIFTCSIISPLLLIQSAVAKVNPEVDPNVDLNKGKRIYQQTCAMCHGRNAEKHAFDSSAIIAQMPANEIITALEKRKNGEIEGAGNSVKARLSEQDMQNVAAYVESLTK
jgi:cytochrome c553